MAGVQVRPGFFRRRAMWRWCLAGGGAALILLGFALGIPSGGASPGHSHRSSAARSTHGHESHRHSGVVRHEAGVTTTTSNASTGLSAPLPVGSSDGTSLGSVRQPPTTLPSVQTLGVVDTPPAVQSVPITTTAAVLITVVALGAFGAGWVIGRRRTIPQG